MRDQRTKRIDESVSEILDRAAPVHILAIAPHRLQLSVNNAAVDFQQVRPVLFWTAVEVAVQAGAKQRGRKHLVQLPPVIETNLSARQLAQPFDNAAVEISQQAISDPFTWDSAQLLFG